MQIFCRYLLVVLFLGLLSACGNDDDKYYMVVPSAASQGGGEDVDPSEPPVPPVPGSAVISLKGGDGASGNGGGSVSMVIASLGDVTLSRYGSVNAGFDLPDYGLQSDLGVTPYVVSGTVTVPIFNPGDAAPPDGTVYMVIGFDKLYLSDGLGTVTTHYVVSGLQVGAGARLILPLNYNTAGPAGGEDQANLRFSSDIVINGQLAVSTLTADDERHSGPAIDIDMGSLELHTEGMFSMGPDALIDLAGGDAVVNGDRGGDGGAVIIAAEDGVFLNGSIDLSGGEGLGSGEGGHAGFGPMFGGLYADSLSMLINQSSIDVHGGSGADGGYPGQVRFQSNGAIYNTADVVTAGGSGAAGVAAPGREIIFVSHVGGIFNSGRLVSDGGNGADAGGIAGFIHLIVTDEGSIINSGNLHASGGACIVNGNGGHSSGLQMISRGAVLCSGDIVCNGGPGKNLGSGGSGAPVMVATNPGANPLFQVATGRIAFSGNIELDGGAGGDGGTSGLLQISNTAVTQYVTPPIGVVDFYGYAGIDLSGGSGAINGGAAGELHMVAHAAPYPVTPLMPSIVNQLPIDAVGGQGAGVRGGDGGTVWIHGEGPYSDDASRGVNNSGAIDLSGGDGLLVGGTGGSLDILAYDYIASRAEIIANGGDASGDNGAGGLSGVLNFVCAGDLNISGDVTASAGNGLGANADGGSAGMFVADAGGRVSNSASLILDGGDANGTGHSGDGGQILIMSRDGSTSNTSSMLSVVPGSGGVGGGIMGSITIDLAEITPTDGTLP